MKRNFIIWGMMIILPTLLLSSQTFVLGEVFTDTRCGYCPSARSALTNMYENEEQFPFLIPILWQNNGAHISPGNSSRRSLYNVTGVPVGVFAGNEKIVGGGSGVFDAYTNLYNRAVNRSSPVEIDLDLSISAQNEMVIDATVSMTGSLPTVQNNHIVFVLTYDLTGIMNPYYIASAKRYSSQSFPLSQLGDSEVFTVSHSLEEDWELERIRAVVFVQSFDPNNPIVYQASKSKYEGLSANISSNVTQGPPELHVQFYDISTPSQSITSWEWDLTGNGVIDSEDINPSFIYTEPGTYSVSLFISDGEDITQITMDDYITVYESSSVEGTISGIFKEQYSPYTIVGNVVIPADAFLEIEPGVTINVEESSISVFGELIADSEDSHPIVFRSDTFWKGLLISNSTGESVIRNVVFSNANQTACTISNSNFLLSGNSFINNVTELSQAAALKVENGENFLISNNVFANNKSALGVGALEVGGSNGLIRNNLFVNNTGYIVAALFLKQGSSIEFINNTVSHNSYTAASGFQVLNSSSSIEVINSIVRGEGNLFSELPNSTVAVYYSNLSGDYEGTGNINEDPLFVNPSLGAGYEYDGTQAVWHLQDESTSIDAGHPDLYYNDPEDPQNPGYALFPAKGTVRNDLGAFGGYYAQSWVSVDNEDAVTPSVNNNSFVVYPNPFNPFLNISLENIAYDNSKPISIEVFNTRGQLVKTIVEDEITKSVKFTWNGLDNDNRPVASGIYFINLNNAGKTFTNKALLLK